MKYIRLKDGRIIVQGEPSDKGFEQGRFEVHNFGNAETLTPFGDDDILVESNSIEKLCDELYFVEDETNTPLRVNRLDETFDKDKKLTECCLEIGGWVTYLKNYPIKGRIKGAIFTSKGIIYVAQMDEKGGWELLWNTLER